LNEDENPYANWDQNRLLARIEQLETEVMALNNRLTRAKSKGFPRGMGSS